MKRWVAVAFASALLSMSNALAQNVPLSSDVMRPTLGAGHDYVRGLNETVNPANGSLSISIQLPTLPSRGITLPFSIMYNSGIVHHMATQEYSGGTTARSVMDGDGYVRTDRSLNGWTDTVPYAAVSSLQQTQSGDAFSVECSISSSYTFFNARGESIPAGLTAISPAGGSGGYADPNYCQSNTGFFAVGQSVIYGYTAQLSDICNGSPCQCNGSVNSSSTPGCPNAAPAFTVTDPDSTVYWFASNLYASPEDGTVSTFPFPYKIEDRNGNVINISGGQPNGSGGLSSLVLTDTSGRTAEQINYPVNSTVPQSYAIGGLTYTLDYATTTASYLANSNQVNPPGPPMACSASFQVNDTSLNVLKHIYLPNGQAYTFQYDGTYGLVNEIDYPNGGWVKYKWDLNSSGSYQADVSQYPNFVSLPGYQPGSSAQVTGGICDYWYQAPVVVEREVGYTNGGDAALIQEFKYSTTPGADYYLWGSKTTTVKTTDNLTHETSQTVYTYSSVNQVTSPLPTGPQLPVQIPVEQSVVTSQWGTGGNPSSQNVMSVSKTWVDPYLMTSEQRTTGSGNTVYQATLTYAAGLLHEDQECYNSDAAGCRTTVFNYFNTTVPCQEIVYSGSDTTGSIISETDAYLDGGTAVCASGAGATTPVPTAVSPISTRDPNYAAIKQVPRGNVTKVVKCTSWPCAGPTTTYSYDETGQRISATDPCGNTSCSDMLGSSHTTTYFYTDSGSNSLGNSNSYLTKITDPLGHNQTFSYDYAMGVLSSSTDENSQTTTYKYNIPPVGCAHTDSLNRLSEVDYPIGNTTYCYDDAGANVSTTTSGITSTSYFDGLGHVVQTRLTTDPDGTDYVDTIYDGQGQVYQKGNPTRCSSEVGVMPTSCSELTWGYSQFNYDPLGRPVLTTNQDGTSSQFCYDNVQSPNVSGSTCTPHAQGLVGGTWTDSVDESGNHWQRTFDGLGRLTYVIEPGALKTSYKYDALGNMLCADQWGADTIGSSCSSSRTRIFTYDALSRLLQSNNPEPGRICYGTTGGVSPDGTNCAAGTGYDANGNLSNKTDFRGITTSYSYDPLNRMLSKSYSGPASTAASKTPSVCYLYDTVATNGIGRLASEWTQPYTTACPQNATAASASALTVRTITTYDAMGRITKESRCAFSPCATASSLQYMYDPAGNLTYSDNGLSSSQSPQIGFTSSYNGAGRLSSVVSTWADGTHPDTLFKADPGVASTLNATVAYSPIGGLSAAFYGVDSTANKIALSDVRSYDSRGRVTAIAVEGTQAGPVPTTTTVTISPNSAAVDSSSTLTVHVNCNAACGSVDLLIDGQDLGTQPLNGTGTVSIPASLAPAFALTVGGHWIQANYLGDPTHAASSGGASYTVAPAGLQPTTTTFSISPDSFTATEAPQLLIHVSCNTACGSVSMTIDGHGWIPDMTLDGNGNIPAFYNMWSISWPSPYLTVGTHTVTAYYQGNSAFAPSSKDFTITINPIGNQQPSISLSFTPSNFSTAEDAVALAHVGCNYACGLVEFDVDGSRWGTWNLDSNGYAQWDTYWWGTPSLGNHVVTAKYLGNSTYAQVTSAPQSITVSPVGTQTTTLTITPQCNSTTVGSAGCWEIVTLNGTDVNGFVQMNVDGNPWEGGALNQLGQQTFYVAPDSAFFTPGNHTLKAYFNGNATYAPTVSSDFVITVTP